MFRMPFSRRAVAASACLAALLVGCAAPPPEVVPAQATIVNHTGRPLGSVQVQPCGGAQWSTLPGSALAPGRSLSFTLPADCVNLNALYADGKVAGTQRGIKREFPFSWNLY